MNFRTLLSLCHVIHLIYWFLDIRASCLNNNWFVFLLCFWSHWSVHISSCYCMALIGFGGRVVQNVIMREKNWEHKKCTLCDACMILTRATIWTMSLYKNIIDDAQTVYKDSIKVNYLKMTVEIMSEVIIR